MPNQTLQGRVKLKKISPDAFIWPADKVALDNIQKLPVLPQLIHQFNKLAIDRISYVHNTASAIRCSPDQLPTLYKLLREACKVLDVSEPELYVRFDYRPNAFTAGVERTYVVLHSSLLDSLTDDELLYVIGHELGHVKCGHLLYRTIAIVLIHLFDAVGKATLGLSSLVTLGVVSVFYEWIRQAEFSCDRAGLLACQDPKVALSATMKMGAGSSRFNSELDMDAFMQQAREHSERTGPEGVAKALLFLLYKWQLSHPEFVYRAKAVDDWVKSGDYEKILSGEYPKIYLYRWP
jgi:Zn-dependent protease with chaperone function